MVFIWLMGSMCGDDMANENGMKHSVGRGKAGKNGRVDGRIGASGRAAADVLPLLAGLSACSGRPTRSGATHGMRSPMVPGGLPRWRSAVVMALLTLAFIGLGARAFWVQVIDQTFYDAEGRKRFSRELAMPAARGDIVDRHGRLLAMSQPVRTVYAMPSALARPLPAQIVSKRILDALKFAIRKRG